MARVRLRQALRRLGHQPWFTVGAVLVLAVGIGLLTALVSLMNAAVLRPWQVPHPNGMVVIHAHRGGPDASGTVSIAEYRYLRDRSQTIAHMAASESCRARVEDQAGRQVSVFCAFVNADYFNAMEVGMAAGPGFVPGDEDYRAPRAVAVISDALWRGRFGADPGIVGRTIRINAHDFSVVGVVAPGFADVGQTPLRTDLWMPLPALAIATRSVSSLAAFLDPRGRTLNRLAGRLSPGSTRASAAGELSLLSREFRTRASLPSNGVDVTDTRPVSGWRVAGEAWTPIVLPAYAPLLLAAVLVLGIACANVGNLLLVRSMSRRRDIAIRFSLGASRARIAGELLMEAALLSAAAGALAFVFAFVVPRVMVGLGFTFGATGFTRAPQGLDALRPSFYAPDALVFWVAVLVTGLTAAIAGLPPALRATHGDLAAVAAERHGHTPGGARLRVAFLAAQIALTTLLLVGAALLTRAVGHAASLNPGFTIRGIQVVLVEPQMPAGSTIARWRAFYLGLRDALRETDLWPVAVSSLPPFDAGNSVMMARRPDEAAGVYHTILARPVSANYFAVLGIPLVEGRIPSSDSDSHEVVVNEAAARQLWPGADPVGRTLQSAETPTTLTAYTVVGVARNVPVRTMSEIEPVVYPTPPWTGATLLIRSAPGVAARVRAIATRLEPHVTATERPMTDYVRDSLGTAGLASRAAWATGALGLLLAMVGAFATFAYAVEERRHEIGIRVALGARPSQIISLVVLTTSRALLSGLAAGFILSVAAVPVLRHFLYGLSPLDPIAYAETAAILIAAAGLATWIPAHRAAGVDPAGTLRRD
jgi:putative ABC transport system permease protein